MCAKRVTLVIDKHNGGVSFLHDDDLVAQIGAPPSSITRLSNVEFDERKRLWTVASVGSGKILFEHARRSECLAWEKEHILELMVE